MKKLKSKFANNIPYLGYAVFIIAVCTSIFSNKDTSGKSYVYNTKGEKVELSKINFTANTKSDSSKKGSLDGTQQINAPKTDFVPVDTTKPFNKITFRQLRTYVPGQTVPQEIKDMDGKNVNIIGFMTPLNALEKMDEFLLCSAPPLSCYCAPPIFINEIIYVKLTNGVKTDFKTGVVKISGRFKVNMDVKDEYSDIIYSIDGVSIE
ncbi:MAG: DUF3299 domain-containing protein [Bacteroidetes bacterium]|nr:DUF3299 domain-containing protein [Bacteroidota bacterium]